MNVTQELTFDIESKLSSSIKVKQNDINAWYIRFLLKRDGAVLDLTNSTVNLYAVKPDGKIIYNSVVINDALNGDITVNFTGQAISADGDMECEFVIENTDGSKLSSTSFIVTVITSINNENALESKNEFTAFNTAIQDISNIKEQLSLMASEGGNHSHTNKTVIDSFSENSGVLYYKGNPIQPLSISWSNVQNKPTIPTDTSELTKSDVYTKTEVMSLISNGGTGGSSNVTNSTINGNIIINGAETTIYEHPSTHNATMITEDGTHRFVTDVEKTNFHSHNNKAVLDALTSNAGVLQYNGQPVGGSGASGGTGNFSSTLYNAKNYGVTGDGVTNDQPALQSLIQSVYDAGGGVIWLPKGIYILQTELKWLSKVSLFGEGIGNTILKTKYNGATRDRKHSAIGFDNTLYGKSLETAFHDCHFRDFEIDGSEIVSTDDYYSVAIKGIYIQYLINCSFENLFIHDTMATGLGVDYLEKSFINNVTVHNCGRGFTTMANGAKVGGAGIGIGTGYLASENSIISNCIATECGSNGIFIEHQKLFDTNGGYNAEGVTITNCICKNNKNNGIGIRGGSKVLITNNNVYSNNVGILVYTLDAEDVKISGNIVLNNTIGDINIGKTTEYVPTLSNIHFENNTTGKMDLYIVEATEIYIKNCKINSLNIVGAITGLYISGNKFGTTTASSILRLSIKAGQSNNLCKDVFIMNNNFGEAATASGTDTTNKPIFLEQSYENVLITNNIFSPFTLNTYGTKVHIYIKTATKVYCYGNKCQGFNAIYSFNSIINSYIEGNLSTGAIAKLGALKITRNGVGVANSMAYINYPSVYSADKTKLFDFAGITNWEISFGGLTNFKYIIGVWDGSNKMAYMGFTTGYTTFTIYSNLTGSAVSCTFTLPAQYDYYKITNNGTEITMSYSSDNVTWTTVSADTGATLTSANFSANFSLTGLTVREQIMCAVPNQYVLSTGALKNGNIVTKPLSISKAGSVVAQYDWTNFGINKELIDVVGGYNAVVSGGGTYQYEVNNYN